LAKRADMLLQTIAAVVAAETGARAMRRMTRQTRAAQVPGWDSLMHSRIVLALEERLALRIDVSRTYELRDLGEFADYLSALAGQRHA
jgi:acyl carrier protein